MKGKGFSGILSEGQTPQQGGAYKTKELHPRTAPRPMHLRVKIEKKVIGHTVLIPVILMPEYIQSKSQLNLHPDS